MRHLTAVELPDGWHFASTSRRGGHPVGHCAEHAPHLTEAEARECYGAYLRERVYLPKDATWSWGGCDAEGCDNPTRRAAQVHGDGYRMAMLCEDHWTVDAAIAAMGLNGPAGDEWRS